MIECKVSDYLTLSLLPDKSNATFDETFDNLIDSLFLRELYYNMEFKCRTVNYEGIFRFSDIQIKVPYQDNYKSEGFGVEFSGSGVSYYIEYLRSKHNCDLRYVLKRLASCTLFGFKVNCSRFDVAFDEIKKIGDNTERCLDLNTIKETTLSGCVVSCLRVRIPELFQTEIKSFIDNDSEKFDKSVDVQIQTSVNPHTGEPGTTVYFGRRGGPLFIRFYDKLAEQRHKKIDVPDNIKSWVRFEMELRKNNSNSVFMCYVKCKNDKQFSREMASRAMNSLRFVENDRSRKYNCSVCTWWVKFLKKAKPKKFTHYKPVYNKFVRAVYSQKRQNAASFSAIFKSSPSAFVDIFVSGLKNPSKNSLAIMNDYNILMQMSPDEQLAEFQRSLEPLSGFEFLRSFTDDSKEQFTEFLNNIYNEVFSNKAEAI